MGIVGACLFDESCQIKLKNVKRINCVSIVTIPDTQNDIFTITAHKDKDLIYKINTNISSCEMKNYSQ